MQFLPDLPIRSLEEDQLGVGKFVELLRDSITQTTPPFAYGVLGDWGVGKTSVLHLLERHFESALVAPKPDQTLCVPIWFNAWLYENEANMVYPLLHQIKQSYEKRGLQPEDAGFKEQFEKVVGTSAYVLGDLGLKSITKLLTGGAFGIKDINEALEQVEKHKQVVPKLLGEWTNNVEELGNAFRGLLDAYASGLAGKLKVDAKSIRFVILIDDLDRCLPETTIAVLESMKNHLLVDKCVFVLALNPLIVNQGIRHKYHGLDFDGRAYLEKILNYTFWVPEPGPPEIGAFVSARLASIARGDDAQAYSASFIQVVRDCGFTNPRRIARILNRYLVYCQAYPPEHARAKDNAPKLIIMAEYFPKIFQTFLRENAEDARNAVAKFGKADFDAGAYEAEFGVTVKDSYAQLCQVKPLFTLEPSEGDYRLQQQAAHVATLTNVLS